MGGGHFISWVSPASASVQGFRVCGDEVLIDLYGVKGSATLTLFVSRVVTDDHDLAVATNHLAAVTDLLDTRLYLHGVTSAGCTAVLVSDHL